MATRPDPKISTSEAVLIGLFLLTLDAIDLIPLAGDLTDVAAAPLVFYYFTKHINGTAYIISCGLDLIPVVQEFPTRSIVWWGTVALDRFAPAKVEELIEATGEKLEGGEGGPGELGSESELGAGVAESTQQGAAVAEQAGESATAEAEIESGRARERGAASESSDAESGGGGGGKDEGVGEGDESEVTEDPMRMGAEITPEEQAEEAAFGSTEVGDAVAPAGEEQSEEGPSDAVGAQADTGSGWSRDGGAQRRRHSTRRRRR